MDGRLTPIKAIKVDSKESFFSIVTAENARGDKWFRGQADVEYALLPSVIRRAQIVEDQYGRRVKPRPLKVFHTRGDRCQIPDKIYINSFKKLLESKGLYSEIIPELKFLCLAQHYGVRTRLLDWTTDAIVALFFALDGREEGKSAGFYILDPVKLNGYFLDATAVFDIDNVPYPTVFPVAFYGPKDDMRMCRQSGNFTIHGSMVWPIDYMYDAKNFLMKIEIPDSVCRDLQNILKGLGITEESIYVMDDEKDKIALEARDLTEQSFEEQLKKWNEEWEKDPEKGIELHTYF